MKAKDRLWLDIVIWTVSIVVPYILSKHVQDLETQLSRLTSRYLTKNDDQLRTHRSDILIFNRTPKSGSNSVQEMLFILAKRNGFDAWTGLKGFPDTKSEMTYLYNPKRRQDTMREIIDPTRRKPFVLTKHMNFLDFSEFYPEDSAVQPFYINFVREPVDRWISWYYYVRAPEYQIDKTPQNENYILKDDPIPIKYLKMSMEECLDKGIIGCKLEKGMRVHGNYGKTGAHISQLAFFCGMHPDCDILESEAMINRAKQNVEKHFPVVGVTDMFNQSLTMLEHFFPTYFSGIFNVIEENPELLKKNVNLYKPRRVDPKIRARIAANLTKEIEFYHFCRQRLQRQVLALDIIKK